MNETYEIGVVEKEIPSPVTVYWVPGLGFESVPVEGGGSSPADIAWVRNAVSCNDLVFVSPEAESWFHRYIRTAGVEPKISTVPAPGTSRGVTFWFVVAIVSAVLLAVAVWVVSRMMGA